MDMAIEGRVLKQIDNMKDEIVDTLREMVRIPTVNPPGDYRKLISFLKSTFDKEFLDVEIIEVPADVLSELEISMPKHNIIAAHRGRKRRPSLYLNAHLDTVSAECIPGDLEKWSVPPFDGVVKNGRIWGRGACDSKGRLASYIAAVVGLKRADARLDGDVCIAATADEETGLSAYTGAGYLAKIGKLQGDYAIVEGMCNEINYANPGNIRLRITTHGDSLHTSQLQPGGCNAIHSMNIVISDLIQYQERLKQQPSSIPNMGFTVVNIGCIKGGLDANMTAANCSIEVSIATVPENDVEDVKATVKERILALKKQHKDLDVDLEFGVTLPACVSKKDSRLIRELQRASMEINGENLEANGLTGYTDMQFFVKSGMEVANFGPGRIFESNLHLPDENIRIKDLINVSKIIALGTLRLLGQKH